MLKQIGSRFARGAAPTLAMVLLTTALGQTATAHAQGEQPIMLQVEVSDSLGLPLPDAKLETFTLMDGGVFWEWVPVAPQQLPEGINLLRFSHPGYRSSTFSIPLRAGSKVSLRVRLMTAGDSAKKDPLEAREVRAIGLAIEGRMRTDVLGRRRILESAVVAEETTGKFGTLLRRVRGTELRVLPVSGGGYKPLAETNAGTGNCQMLVMLNGDRRQVLPFAAFDQLYGTADLEVMEVFPRSSSLPSAYQVSKPGCGMLVAWFKSL
ncbi:MAG TPA: hypothetical protein VM076_15385 [Gemmatimonadaceae bacterium]|nr:hypothetical protein [Gemmatimonadaceae bacterium]